MKLAIPSSLYDNLFSFPHNTLLFGKHIEISGQSVHLAMVAHRNVDDANLRVAKSFLKRGRFILPAFANQNEGIVRRYHLQHPNIDLFAMKPEYAHDAWDFFDYSKSTFPRKRSEQIMKVEFEIEDEELVDEIHSLFEKNFPYRPYRY